MTLLSLTQLEELLLKTSSSEFSELTLNRISILLFSLLFDPADNLVKTILNGRPRDLSWGRGSLSTEMLTLCIKYSLNKENHKRRHFPDKKSDLMGLVICVLAVSKYSNTYLSI